MLALIDTNVLLDVLLKREPFYQDSGAAIKLCNSKNSGCFSVVQCRDIYYLLSKYGLSTDDAKTTITLMVNKLSILNANSSDVNNALSSKMSDFEDALIAYCAARHGVTHIITRNEKDFSLSPIKAISPQDFIATNASN